MPIKFQYPEEGWSTGTMRKVAMKKGPAPDLAEMDRAAGVGLTARGGSAVRSEVTRGPGGLSPEAIQSQKAQTEASGQPWQIGSKVRKKRKEGDLESLGLFEAMDTLGVPVEMISGKAPSEWSQKLLEQATSFQAKQAKSTGATEIGGLDANLKKQQISIDDWDPAEQAARAMKLISQRYSIGIGGKKKSEEPKEEGGEE